MLADNTLTTESMSSEILVDDYYRFTVLSIMLVEEAAFEQLDAHDLEIVGAHAGAERERLLVGTQSIGGGPIRYNVFLFAHGDDVCERGEFHVRQAPSTVDYVPLG